MLTIAPVATITSANPTIIEGQDLSQTATVSDPDTNDMHTFNWDLDGDGMYDDAMGANPTITWATLQALTPSN